MCEKRDYREFVCGWGAANVNILLTFPINKLIFRQQLLGISTTTAFNQLKSEGYWTLYRGVLPPLLQKTTSVSIMFGMYEEFNKKFEQTHPDMPIVVIHTASALLAGCMEAVLMPFERIQTLLQNKTYQEKYKNTIHAFRELRCLGFAEYYRGLTPILLRNGPSNVIFFQFRGEVKKFLPKSDKKSYEIFSNFVSGGLLGAVISTIFYPVNVVKTYMQSSVGGSFPGFIKSFKHVFNERDRSVKNMFKGFHVNYSRSLLSWGLINASYELLKSALYTCR
ncbi:hypothetical protein HELRODRAFT_73742 [Helobdella robusta]|uniref:Mitochondrial carrier protein n=1 Tax=Helobdella robusta TaxID=6412 RepID=T1G1H9_HELRO|nr:hypothetical protein HELRODRAFT_73742 [Helobdella robusta]ESO09579.1 hypothetical protein HELRODRAFT_73742 [Helobdella robusta]